MKKLHLIPEDPFLECDIRFYFYLFVHVQRLRYLLSDVWCCAKQLGGHQLTWYFWRIFCQIGDERFESRERIRYTRDQLLQLREVCDSALSFQDPFHVFLICNCSLNFWLFMLAKSNYDYHLSCILHTIIRKLTSCFLCCIFEITSQVEDYKESILVSINNILFICWDN